MTFYFEAKNFTEKEAWKGANRKVMAKTEIMFLWEMFKLFGITIFVIIMIYDFS